MWKVDHFERMIEAQEALDYLKNLLTRAPILVAPEEIESLMLYIAVTAQVVSLVLMVQRQEEGCIRPLQRPIYFISEVLTSAKTHYP
jgi:dsDNA-binding SOS-regulon protein